jgi:hypothetical protein
MATCTRARVDIGQLTPIPQVKRTCCAIWHSTGRMPWCPGVMSGRFQRQRTGVLHECFVVRKTASESADCSCVDALRWARSCMNLRSIRAVLLLLCFHWLFFPPPQTLPASHRFSVFGISHLLLLDTTSFGLCCAKWHSTFV